MLAGIRVRSAGAWRPPWRSCARIGWRSPESRGPRSRCSAARNQIRRDRRARAGRGRPGTGGGGRDGRDLRLAGGGNRRVRHVAGRDPGPDPRRPVGPQQVRRVQRERGRRGDRRAHGRVRGLRYLGRPRPARGARSRREAPGLPGARAARRACGHGASGRAPPARGPTARVCGGPADARRRRPAGAAAPGHGGDAGGHAGSGAARLEKLAAGIGRVTPAPLAFVQCPEAEPTNDSPGRAPRRAAAFRETSGQIEGAPRPRGAPRGHAARVMTWGAHGKGAAAEWRRLSARPRAPNRARGGGALTSCAARCRLTSKPKPRLATATAPRSHA